MVTRTQARYHVPVVIVVVVLLLWANQANAQNGGTSWQCPDTFNKYDTLNECRDVCVSNCKAVDNTATPPPAEPAKTTPLVKDAQPPTNLTITPLSSQPVGGGINIGFLQDYSESIIGIINGLFVPVLMAIAFIYFLVGVYKYFILGADKEEERKKGREFVLWSVIGFVVIFSIWGLVGVVGGTFNLQPGGTAPDYPLL